VRKKIGECLIQAGLITEQDLQVALAEQARTGERVGAVLVRLNMATEKQITKAVAYQLGFPYVSLIDEPPDPAAIRLLTRDGAQQRVCVAVRLEKNLLTVALSDPLQQSLVEELELETGYRVKPVVATRTDILQAIETGYPDKAAVASAAARGAALPTRRSPARLRSSGLPPGPQAGLASRAEAGRVEPDVTAATPPENAGETAPIVDLVDLVVTSAIGSRASDVHIEPGEKTVAVRHRLDGVLKQVMELPAWAHEGLVARLKTMAGMNASETRLSQEGRFRPAASDGRSLEFRVSTLRTLHGEKMLLRAVEHGRRVPPLEELGFPAAAMEQVRQLLRRRQGLLLLTGPAGSGRTTTLGSVLGAIASGETNVVTIEDRIEYRIAGVNQTEIADRTGETFASALRAVLRQDADVVAVGELADAETARLALQAAQSGRFVVSTLMTDDAPSAITRLLDMNIEPYLVAAALAGVIAQRLVRRPCDGCRRQYTPDAETLRALNIDEPGAAPLAFHRGGGCDACHHTGYHGRTAIFEVLPVDGKIRRLIAQRAGEDLIRDAAIAAGMVTLGEDGLARVTAGTTTPDELLRVVTGASERRTVCPGCGGALAVDYVACPACGHRLHSTCGRCGRALQAGWHYCPFCAAGTARPRKSRDERRPESPPSRVAEFKNQNR
jgi:type IV pilus assembly protein PilB